MLITEISWPVIIAGCLGTSATVTVNMIYYVMIDKINEKLPESKKIPSFGVTSEVRTKFKNLYPGNKLVVLLDSCWVVIVLSGALIVRFWVFR
jgi:hypothetical protein